MDALLLFQKRLVPFRTSLDAVVPIPSHECRCRVVGVVLRHDTFERT